jgi:hypothetical protein
MQTITITPRRFTEDGLDLLAVPLFGKSGAGREFIIEEAVWRAGRDHQGWPPKWITIDQFRGKKSYVATCSAPLSIGGKPVFLARLIACPGPNHCVMFRNSDELDMRRTNLEIVTVAEWWERIRAGRRGIPHVEATFGYEGMPF